MAVGGRYVSVMPFPLHSGASLAVINSLIPATSICDFYGLPVSFVMYGDIISPEKRLCQRGHTVIALFCYVPTSKTLKKRIRLGPSVCVSFCPPVRYSLRSQQLMVESRNLMCRIYMKK